MQPVITHEGDDLPTLFLHLKDLENGCFYDLSAATTIVTAKFRQKNTATVLQTVVCTKVDSGIHGWVKMEWPATGLDVTFGNYEIEVSADFNGKILTANVYFWNDDVTDDAKTLPVKVREDF